MKRYSNLFKILYNNPKNIAFTKYTIIYTMHYYLYNISFSDIMFPSGNILIRNRISHIPNHFNTFTIKVFFSWHALLFNVEAIF